jgi:hypothetical protein
MGRVAFAAIWLLFWSLWEPVPDALRGLRVLPLLVVTFLPPITVLL